MLSIDMASSYHTLMAIIAAVGMDKMNARSLWRCVTTINIGEATTTTTRNAC